MTDVIGALENILATSSRDWGESRDGALLFGIICSWDDDDPELSGMADIAERHGWDAAQVERVRQWHREFTALQRPTTTPDTMTDAPDYDAIEALADELQMAADDVRKGWGVATEKLVPALPMIADSIPALIARCRELEAKVAGIQSAIDRADPPGQWRAGIPAVSVPTLRSILDSEDPT